MCQDISYFSLDTSIGGLTMADQYLQLTTRLASTNVYGFGEHIHPSLRHNLQDYNSWGMFARDEPPKVRIPIIGGLLL